MSYTYLSSPYSSPDPIIRQARFRLVRSYVVSQVQRGSVIYSPIISWHEITEAHDLPTDAEFWWKQNKAMLTPAQSLWVLKLPGWQESLGVEQEIQYALSITKPVIYVDL